jgi:hypothetical protein
MESSSGERNGCDYNTFDDKSMKIGQRTILPLPLIGDSEIGKTARGSVP